MRPKVQPKQFILKGQPIVWVFHLLAQKAKKKYYYDEGDLLTS